MRLLFTLSHDSFHNFLVLETFVASTGSNLSLAAKVSYLIDSRMAVGIRCLDLEGLHSYPHSRAIFCVGASKILITAWVVFSKSDSVAPFQAD